MPWVAVTDPNEIAAAEGMVASKGGAAKPGIAAITRPEQATREEQQQGIVGLKNFIKMTAEAEHFNRTIPAGRFNAKVNEVGQSFPPSWQPRDVGAYQSFLGLRQKMLKPAMAIAGNGQKVSAGEVNTPSELNMMMTAVPGPEKEAGANRYLNESLFKQAQLKLARDSFASYWRDKYGSAHAKDPAGRTLDVGFDEHMSKGSGAKWRDKKMSQYYDEAAARLKPKAAGAPSDIAAILKKYGAN